jgi:hypothetical protein
VPYPAPGPGRLHRSPEPREGGEAPGFGVGVANEFGTGMGLWAKVIKQAIGAPRSVSQVIERSIGDAY